MVKTIGLILLFMLTGFAAGNYFGGAGKVYLGDVGWVHYKDSFGTWHAVKADGPPCQQEVKILPECDDSLPGYNFGKCVQMNMRQH